MSYIVDQAVKEMNLIRAAEAAVKPFVGDVSDMAMDSANAVYEHALRQLGHDTSKLVPSAMKAVFEMATRTGKTGASMLAADAAVAEDYLQKFPGAARIKRG